jgi:beta-galactosidase
MTMTTMLNKQMYNIGITGSTRSNRKRRVAVLMLFVPGLFLSCSSYQTYEERMFEEKEPPDWENPAVFQINKEAPRAHFIPYLTETQARTRNPWQSPLVKSLNGTWQFHLAKNPGERP